MSTLDDLINEVQLNLLGYVLDQEQLTTLSGSINTSVATITVADGTVVSNGLVEIDEELIYVTAVDTTTNLLTVIRGMYGSTAQSHNSGAILRNNPKIPRWAIKRAINSTVTSSYPDLFAVSSTDLTSNGIAVTYSLPADCDEVISVHYDLGDVSLLWAPVRRWRFNKTADTVDWANGKSIDIVDTVRTGRLIHVAYRKVPAEMTAITDTFATVTGLPDSARECIVYGACAKLTGYVEPARLSDDSAEARFIDSQQPGSALTAGRYFYSLYLQARAEENRRLLDRYPVTTHFTR